MIRKNYVVLNATNFKADAFKQCETKKISFGKTMVLNDVNDSIMSNMYRNYLTNQVHIDAVFNTDGIPRVGYIEGRVYDKVVEVLGLEDKYKLPMRSEDKVDEKKSNVSKDTDIKADLDELNKMMKELLITVRQIGNLNMQILEKMPSKKPLALLPKGENS